MASVVQKLSPSKAAKQMDIALTAGLVPFLRSSPGVGKSSIVKQFAKKHNLMLIDIRLSTCAPEDLNGLPFFKDGQASFIPFDFWPLANRYKKDGSDFPINPDTITEENPNGNRYDGFLIFCDEFNQAPKSVQAAAYRLILDRQVGMNDLHDRVLVCAAGNLTTDRAIAHDIGTALQSRFVHLQLEATYEDWLTNVAIPNKYDPRIVGYLAQYPSKIMDFDPRHDDLTFCCPRTWEFANKILKKNPGSLDDCLPLLQGTLTSNVAVDLAQFAKVFADIVPVETILRDPMGAKIPNDKALLWATTMAMIENMDLKNFGTFAQYADRLDLPMRIMFYRSAIARHPGVSSTPAFTASLNILAKYLNS